MGGILNWLAWQAYALNVSTVPPAPVNWPGPRLSARAMTRASIGKAVIVEESYNLAPNSAIAKHYSRRKEMLSS